MAVSHVPASGLTTSEPVVVTLAISRITENGVSVTAVMGDLALNHITIPTETTNTIVDLKIISSDGESIQNRVV